MYNRHLSRAADQIATSHMGHAYCVASSPTASDKKCKSTRAHVRKEGTSGIISSVKKWKADAKESLFLNFSLLVMEPLSEVLRNEDSFTFALPFFTKLITVLYFYI